MNIDLFEAVDHYIDRLFVAPDLSLEAAIKAGLDAGLPQIQVSPGQGKLLYLLAKLCGAKRILEIGTLAGYSAIWMARALPKDGKLITLEFEKRHAGVAYDNFRRAGITDKAEIIIGPALDTLKKLRADNVPPFDMVFLDADKEGYKAYLEEVLHLVRPGSLILADNVIRAGGVLHPEKGDAMVKGSAAFNAALAADKRVDALILQQVGIKGHDGLAIAIVKDGAGKAA